MSTYRTEFQKYYKKYCERCGSRFHYRELQRDPTGFIVCRKCWLDKPRKIKRLL